MDFDCWLLLNDNSSSPTVDKDWNQFFLLGIWNLWIQKNHKAFKNRACNPNLVKNVEMQVREFIYCVANQSEKKDLGLKEVKWTKPVAGWYKLNTNGSVNSASGIAGLEGLLGIIMASGSQVLQKRLLQIQALQLNYGV